MKPRVKTDQFTTLFGVKNNTTLINKKNVLTTKINPNTIIYQVFLLFMQYNVSYPSGNVDVFINIPLEELWKKYQSYPIILLTNEIIIKLYPEFFQNKKTIIIPAGEHTKELDTITSITQQLLKLEATRNTLLIGVGGGVLTDITGFVASIYLRGIKFGYIPTTLLAMVDAAIGGKNGVNFGNHKNILGTITQPKFIAINTTWLKTLHHSEWSNGFAEIIKYACIADSDLFNMLKNNYLGYYQEDISQLEFIIAKCINIKEFIVIKDEHEKGERKLLNFGHTLAHALENLYNIPHGQAVSIGMVFAIRLSEQLLGFPLPLSEKVITLLKQYYLPTEYPFDTQKVMELLIMDKKRVDNTIQFILLDVIGKGVIQSIPINLIQKKLENYGSHS